MDSKEDINGLNITPESQSEFWLKKRCEVLEDITNIKVNKNDPRISFNLILNSIVYTYITTIIDTVPKELREKLVEEHFARIRKDLFN